MVLEGQQPTRPVKRRRHVLRWISLAVVLVVGGALLTAYIKYRTISDSIHRVTINVKDLGKRPPVYSTSSMNILVFGSDSRTGLDHHEQVLLHTGDASNSGGAGNTDTIILLHISPGRHLVTAMSIPRDTMVPAYQCDSGAGYPGQQADPNNFVQINSLLAAGGPSCLWKTVEQQTGIHIDHFVEIGLAGFVNVVNDLNGVNVCAPFNVDDPVSGLVLPAGEHHINGITALSFWRTREDIGLGSDLQRIQRDQFMSAQVVKGILGSGLLNSPTGLLKVLSDVAPSLTTDSGLSLTDLLHIGLSLHGLPAKDVQFVTAPNQPYTGDPQARVQFAQPQADTLFSAIAHDVTVPKTAPAASARPEPGATATAASPGSVKVEVLNGSGVTGIAGQAASALSGRGFDVTGTGDAATFGYGSSVIEYSSSTEMPQVNTLKKQLTSVTVMPDPSLPAGSLDLILGSDFTGFASQSATAQPTAPGSAATGTPAPGETPKASPTATPSLQSLATANGGISAAASCSSDASSFEGPLSNP